MNEINVTGVFMKDTSQVSMLLIGMNKKPLTIIFEIIRILYKY